MESNWQLIVVVAMVSVAIWYLVRRARAVLKGTGGASCDSCDSCSETDVKQVPLVELDLPQRDNSRRD